MRNINQIVKTLIRSDQDILISILCENLIVTNLIERKNYNVFVVLRNENIRFVHREIY